MSKINSVSKDRNNSTDIIKIIAILLVIFCHVAGHTFNPATISEKYFYMAFNTLGKIGVPLFFMVSGYYLLNRDYDSDAIKKFYIHSLLPLILCWEIWIIFYNIFFVINGQPFVGFVELIKEMAFLRRVDNLTHDWYMYAIIIYYAIIPFIANGFKNIEKKWILIVLSILVIFTYLIPTFFSLTPPFLTYFNLNVMCYLIIGYLLKYYLQNKYTNLVNLLGFLLVFVSSLAWQFYKSKYGETIYKFWYDNFFILLLSFFLFSFLYKIFDVKNNRILLRLSSTTFGVYLIHPLFLYLFNSNIHLSNSYLQILLFFVLTTLISYSLSMIISYIPYVSKYLIYYKKPNSYNKIKFN